MKPSAIHIVFIAGICLVAAVGHGDDQVDTAKKRMQSQALVEQAREQLRKTDLAGAEKNELLLAHAYDLYQQAFAIQTEINDELKKRLLAMPKVLGPNDNDKVELRNRLRGEYLQSQLVSAAILEERADAAEPGSEKSLADLRSALAGYADIHKRYRTRLAGLYARMYQARCLTKLKEYKDAIGILAELFEQPDGHPAFLTLHQKAYLLALDAWSGISPPRHAEAIHRVEQWLAKRDEQEMRHPDVLHIHLKLGKLRWEYADRLAKTNAAKADIDELRRDAVKDIEAATGASGEVRNEANELLKKWRPQ